MNLGDADDTDADFQRALRYRSGKDSVKAERPLHGLQPAAASTHPAQNCS
jgi:hypothetical protein